MQKRLAFTILSLACLLVACGERFDYRHKYVGDYDVLKQWQKDLPYETSNGYDLPAKLVVDFGYATDQLDFALTIDGYALQNNVGVVDRDEIIRSPTAYAFAGRFIEKHSLYFEYQSDSPTWEHYSWQVKGNKH